MKILGALIICLLIAIPLSGNEHCQCRRAKSKETTRWGGNMWLASQEEGVFKSIAGKVQYPTGEVMEDALIEVFDKPDYLACEYLPDNPNGCSIDPPENQRRKAACRTGKDGAFCFSKLPAGTYELRVSKGVGWNVVHYVIVVKPKDVKAKEGGVEIIMNVGG